MELHEAMRTTAATRRFTGEAVPDEVLVRVLDSARFAPSGGNRQPWTVVVVQDPALRARLAELYQLGWREYVAHFATGTVPFAPLDRGRWRGPAVDLDAARATPVPDELGEALADVPVLLVLCARLDQLAVTDNGLDRQSIVGGASVYPFAHNILLAARAEGLGGVLTTVLVRQEPAVRELLGIPEGVAVAGMIVLGHPERIVTRLSRRPVDELAVRDRFDGAPFGADGAGPAGGSR